MQEHDLALFATVNSGAFGIFCNKNFVLPNNNTNYFKNQEKLFNYLPGTIIIINNNVLKCKLAIKPLSNLM